VGIRLLLVTLAALSTSDTDELLYGVIDDVARSVAWRWSAPSRLALIQDNRFRPRTEPDAPEVLSAIEAVLT
jgi:hypothetical protein